MFFPRFSIRTILAVTTLAALLFLMVGLGYRGQNWAWGVAIGVASLAVAALVHAGCFVFVWYFARLLPQNVPPAALEPALPTQEDAR